MVTARTRPKAPLSPLPGGPGAGTRRRPRDLIPGELLPRHEPLGLFMSEIGAEQTTYKVYGMLCGWIYVVYGIEYTVDEHRAFQSEGRTLVFMLYSYSNMCVKYASE